MTIDPQLFRSLPSVDALLREPVLVDLLARWRRQMVVDAAQAELDLLRVGIRDGDLTAVNLPAAIASLPERIEARVRELTTPSFRRVINATGIVVHTNLGRSPLPTTSLRRIAELAGRYTNLEFDLESGNRGNRDSGIRRFIRLLFPGWDGLVVNNNAAAILLALNTLADGREAVISRGRIIEIGDGFRINQIQEKSGAKLVEVGTTNRTHAADFAEAIGERTALLLSVHPSNYRVVGFTADVSLRELVALGAERSLPVLEDWGSGCITDPAAYGISGEESASQVLAAGPDLVCFSGDKLLGGPQAGIVVGRRELIERLRRNHLYRALRVGKLTLLALEEVLRAYLQGREVEIPVLEMLRRDLDSLRARAAAIAEAVGSPRLHVVESEARVGGGAAPEVVIPSTALAIDPPAGAADTLKDRLRANDPPIIARVQDDAVLLDLRTVFLDEDAVLISTLGTILS